MNDNAIKYGILRTRDLVELWYGARMATDTVESVFTGLGTNAPSEILPISPRRIRYEIVLFALGANQNVEIGSARAFAAGVPQHYYCTLGASPVIIRTWLDDLDDVTSQVFAQPSNSTIIIATRVTFLTPLPADES